MNKSDRTSNEPDRDQVSEPDDGLKRKMSFLEHLEEFRWTVARSFVAFLVGVIIVCCFLPQIGGFLQVPLQKAYASNGLEYTNLISYKPMGVFSVFIQIALLGGLVLSMPFVLYFMACFIIPGLTERERQIVRPACFAGFVLFLAGVAVSYYVLLPLNLTISVYFNQMMGQILFLAASEYYNLVVWFSLATGAIFQFPLIIVTLIFIQVLAVAQLKAIRRAVLVGLMVFSALLTPGGDFATLIITTSIFYALYELAIMLGSRIEKKYQSTELTGLDNT